VYKKTHKIIKKRGISFMKIAKFSKLLALLLSFVMLAGLFTACSENEEGSTDNEGTPPPPVVDNVGGNGGELPAPTGTAELPDGFVGIDFSNGNIGFLAMNYKAPNATSAATIELGQWGGANAAKITPVGDYVPFIAIDACSLLGSRVGDVASVEVGIAVQHDGGFQAIQGEIVAYYGEDRDTTKGPWSVFVANRNPNAIKLELRDDQRMVPGAYNMFIIERNGGGASSGDNSVDAGGAPGILYITYIGFKDDAGNFMAVDADAGFNEPAGFNEATIRIVELGEFQINAPGAGHNGWRTDGVDNAESPFSVSDFVNAYQLVLEFAAPIETEDAVLQLVWQGGSAGWSWKQNNDIFPVPGGTGGATELVIDLASAIVDYGDWAASTEDDGIKFYVGFFEDSACDLNITRAYLVISE
jgi:hypothetical protein